VLTNYGSLVDFLILVGQLSIGVGWALAFRRATMATTPKSIIDAIKMGHERYVLADTVVRLTEEFRADYAPSAKTWEAFALLLILRRMLDVHQRGRESSAVVIARAIGMPRTTVYRKLAQLKKMGAVAQNGSHFSVLPEFMNASHMIEGFKHRRQVWHRAYKKMSATDT
jgi:hypothetical protein